MTFTLDPDAASTGDPRATPRAEHTLEIGSAECWCSSSGGFPLDTPRDRLRRQGQNELKIGLAQTGNVTMS